MAKTTKRKGKSKQKAKKKVQLPVNNVSVPQNAEQAENVEQIESAEQTSSAPTEQVTQTVATEQPKELTAKEIKKAEKQKLKEQQERDKEKAKKQKQEAREKAGKVSLGRRLKETGSELKKVSWPTFGEVVKKTGIVIAVVIFFAVVLFAFDRLLAFLYDIFTSGLS